MRANNLEPLVQIMGVIILAVLIGIAGSYGSVRYGGMPVFALCGIIAFTIQWIAFIPSYIRQSEHSFDLVGGITYLAVITCAIRFSDGSDLRSTLLATLVSIWAIRLSTFLYRRIQAAGSDRRFTDVKPHLMRYLMYWTTQGLWVFGTLAAALAAISSAHGEPMGWAAVSGSIVWVCGFAIEVTADRQKSAFRNNPTNTNRYITSGLWAWSRHPNYFGEVILWCGIAIIAAPALVGWQWLTMLSPVFVFLLLTRASGIPILEGNAEKRWGSDPEYQAYKSRTPQLMMLPPKA